jgi:hypothetical protein
LLSPPAAARRQGTRAINGSASMRLEARIRRHERIAIQLSPAPSGLVEGGGDDGGDRGGQPLASRLRLPRLALPFVFDLLACAFFFFLFCACVLMMSSGCAGPGRRRRRRPARPCACGRSSPPGDSLVASLPSAAAPPLRGSRYHGISLGGAYDRHADPRCTR